MSITLNEFVSRVALRASKLADLPIDEVRLTYPEVTDTGGELIKMCKEHKLSRGQMIEAILVEEFSTEFPIEVEV